MLMTHNNPVIEIRNLVRRYGRTDAVDGLSLSVPAGRCYGFFGRNGAGKTTTIKCLLNLLQPTSGEVRVFGMDPAREEVAVKSRISYVPDYVAFYPWMTVRDALGYFVLSSSSSASIRARRRVTSRKASARNSRSSSPSAPSPNCSSSTSRHRASIRSFGASSSGP